MSNRKTFQVCVGHFKLFPSPCCLLVYPVVDGSDCPAVIFWLDEIGDAAYVLAKNAVNVSLDTRSKRGNTDITSRRESRAISHFRVAIERTAISNPRD